ncbi:MAG: MBOAT family protein [Alphaproteobacteria bacterium]|nr:MBOAT family protein [Alphaproteobacteria bacterium]
MPFNSLEFVLFFLPLVYGGYLFAVAQDRRAAIFWLLAVSTVFYARWNIAHTALLLGLATVVYVLGDFIERRRGTRKGKVVLCLGVALNLGVLAYFKYAFFLVAIVSPEMARGLGLDRIVLPLAISFFVFQKIAYLIDIHRGGPKAESFRDFLLFVAFFPQLVAGPIVHWRELGPQIAVVGGPRDRAREAAVGLSIFAIGLFKKVAIADSVAPIADATFTLAELGAGISFFEGWIGALAFSIQIYFDFSGYTDMAIGLALMFGIRLPENFNSPYKARDFADFWRRWHMTLSAFLRDYLYKPLGGNRAGPVRRWVNVMIVMLLGGLWHGASWTFVAWGAAHGMLIAASHFYRAVNPARDSPFQIIAERGVVFAIVTAVWVFFRAETFGAAWRVLSAMADPFSAALPGRLALALEKVVPGVFAGGPGMFPNLAAIGRVPDALGLAILAFGLIVCFFLPNTRQLFDRARELAWPNLASAVILGFMAGLALVLLPRSGRFIYFQF